MAWHVARSPSASERIVVGVWVLLTALWAAVALWAIVSYRGSSGASSWSARVVMMLIAGGATAAAVLVVRAVWRRALQMSLRGGRCSVWVARRPWWQLAGFCWVVLGLPQVAEAWWLAPAQHLSVGLKAGALLESVVGASFVALVMRVIWRRQLHNRQLFEEP